MLSLVRLRRHRHLRRRPVRALAGAAGAVTLACSAATPALATYPGLNGRIAFGSDVGGNVDIYSARPNGRGVRRLTDDPRFDACPAYSADGRTIAWCKEMAPAPRVVEIWTMRADGSDQRQLTHLGGFATFPDFAPDGRRVAFTGSLPPSTDPEILSINRRGTELVNLTESPGPDLFPAYSPDGRRIAFISARSGSLQVWVMNADGSHPVQLTTDAAIKGQLPDWSPDGRQIAYATDDPALGRDIWIIDADGRNPRQVTNDGAIQAGPAWSPDGRSLAYLEIGADNLRRVYVVCAADGKPRALAPFGNQFVPAWQPLRRGR
jgi:TolB protein